MLQKIGLKPDWSGRRALSLSDVNDLCSTLFRVALSTGIGKKQASYDEAVLWVCVFLFFFRVSSHVATYFWLLACKEWSWLGFMMLTLICC